MRRNMKLKPKKYAGNALYEAVRDLPLVRFGIHNSCNKYKLESNLDSVIKTENLGNET